MLTGKIWKCNFDIQPCFIITWTHTQWGSFYNTQHLRIRRTIFYCLKVISWSRQKILGIIPKNVFQRPEITVWYNFNITNGSFIWCSWDAFSIAMIIIFNIIIETLKGFVNAFQKFRQKISSVQKVSDPPQKNNWNEYLRRPRGSMTKPPMDKDWWVSKGWMEMKVDFMCFE